MPDTRGDPILRGRMIRATATALVGNDQVVSVR